MRRTTHSSRHRSYRAPEQLRTNERGGMTILILTGTGRKPPHKCKKENNKTNYQPSSQRHGSTKRRPPPPSHKL
ncbi:unnamed protein product [Sphagnum balticum]